VKMGRNLKDLLRRVPGLVVAHRHYAYWWPIIRNWPESGESMNDRSHLDRDWDFESPAEQERHELTLSAVARQCPDLSAADVLELGCSDGVFTTRLAGRCASVTACDISPVGLELASRRCRPYDNVAFRKLDIARDAIPAPYDIVFAMDVLDSLHGRWRLRKVLKKLAEAVRPQGLLAVSACRIPPELRGAFWQAWLPEGGDALVPLIARDPFLILVHSEVHPEPGLHFERYIEHVIAVFRKAGPDRKAEAVE